MRTKSSRILIAISLTFALSLPRVSFAADTTREFVNSCVYGTMAGTLVGLASLAFTSQPGDNLQNIARGASLGLYAGIILGIYAVNSESSATTPAGQQAPASTENSRGNKNPDDLDDVGTVTSAGTPAVNQIVAQQTLARENMKPRLFPGLAPVVTQDHGVEGAQVGVTLSF